MLAALIIVFREALEAGLVIGVVLAATRGLRNRSASIALGVAGGIAGACLVALFAGRIAEAFHGSGQEALNAVVLLVAVAMLCWHNAWMAGHGRDLAGTLAAVGRDVAEGRRPLAALAIVCGAAVLREGSEVVLFLYGVVAGGGATAADIATGGLLGILAGAAVSALLYRGLIAIPLRYLFATLTTVITLLAAGLAAQSVDFLEQGGWLQVWSRPIWTTAWLLPQDGLPGRILHTLVGYSDRPTGLELLAYGLVVAAMAGLMRLAAPRPARPTRPHAPPSLKKS